jgi:excisionase family DNA binding protein
MPLVYTVEEIAEQTGKSAEYIRALIRNDQLPAKRFGKTPLVLADDFAAFLASLPDA